MKKKYSKVFLVVIVLGLILTLFWIEFSPWSSRAVAKHNNGYGTFDMKAYTPEDVEDVLHTLTDEGFDIQYRYYIGDYIFILFLALVQYNILKRTSLPDFWKTKPMKLMFVLSFVLIALRAVADIIENTLLFKTIISYPVINTTVIKIASYSTIIKLLCIGLWVISIAVIYVYKKRNVKKMN